MQWLLCSMSVTYDGAVLLWLNDVNQHGSLHSLEKVVQYVDKMLRNI